MSELVKRCLFTGNLVGTDTWSVYGGCPCDNCRQYREGLAAMVNSDLREHIESGDCWCNPIQDPEYPGVWIHNSMDRREEYETVRKMS